MRYVTRTSALEYEEFNSAKSRLIDRAEKFGEISYKVFTLFSYLKQLLSVSKSFKFCITFVLCCRHVESLQCLVKTLSLMVVLFWFTVSQELFWKFLRLQHRTRNSFEFSAQVSSTLGHSC